MQWQPKAPTPIYPRPPPTPVMTRKQAQVAKPQAAATRDFVTVDKIQVQVLLGCQLSEGLRRPSPAQLELPVAAPSLALSVPRLGVRGLGASARSPLLVGPAGRAH